MKYSSIKKVCIILFFSFLPLFIFSCKKGELDDSQKTVMNNVNNIMYEYTYNALSSNNTYSYPSLKTLITRPIIIDGRINYIYELLFNNVNRVFYIDSLYENLYDPHSDNGSWVEDLITSMEEERLGHEIEQMENIIFSDEIKVDETEKSEEAETLIEELESNNILDNSKNLASAEYGKEIFIPQKNGENWILIHAFENDVKRFFYDSLFRCYKQENWNIKQGDSEKIITKIETSFYEDTYIPKLRIITEENSIKKQKYNSDGYLLKEDIYSIFEKKENITSSLTLKYNKENKVIESNLIEYKYKDYKFSALDYSFNKKYLYKYNKDDIPPNFDYYENNELKISCKYKAKNDYTEEIYFADGFSVISTYKDGKIQKEVFTLNGIEERIKNYE